MVQPSSIQLEEKILIDGEYQKLLDKIGPLDPVDADLIDRAYQMAYDGHIDQRRKSGEPYILHPIEVARICFDEIGLGPTAIVAALLHDVVEDTEVSLARIEEIFGEKIGIIVDGLTKLEKTYQYDMPQAENFKKVLRAMLTDVRVVLIKMADRLHNMRTLKNMPYEKQLRIAGETNYIYAPLAHRLGLYNIKTELQDLCMKVMDRPTYDDIAGNLKQTKRDRQAYIEKFIQPLEEKLRTLNIAYRLQGRPKSISSIANKILKKKVPFEEIYDLFAVRIILDVPLTEEKVYCWQVYSMVTDVHKPIPERLKDWITTPKSNGYESLHTTVIGPEGKFVEVQIRTERMDAIAERGFAAHWKYKGIKNQQDHYGPWLDSIREILEDQENDNVGFINDLKSQLFKEEVFVYTPKGDMKVLPKGATGLDFAFSIHSDVGYHATSIKVNNKLEPLSYELKNGDQVTIGTSKNQKPTERWLKMVKTGRAKSKIKSVLKEEKRKKGILGKELLERKLAHMKLSFEDNIDFLVHHFKYNNRPDLYYDISQELIDIQAELRKFHIDHGKLVVAAPAETVSDNTETKENLLPRKKRNRKGKKNDLGILLNGEDTTAYKISLSQCCNPVHGDAIFGFISTFNGVNIHRILCPNAEHLMSNYAYRIMKAEWEGDQQTEFAIEIILKGEDIGVGVIQKITNLISTVFALNMKSFQISGEDGCFEGKVSVEVSNLNQAKDLISELNNLEGITNVYRQD